MLPFSVAAKDGLLPSAPFPPSCHHKRGFWPTSGTSGTAELPQFNPNLKDKLNANVFGLEYAAVWMVSCSWLPRQRQFRQNWDVGILN